MSRHQITLWEKVLFKFSRSFTLLISIRYLVGDNGVTGSGKGMTEVAGKIKHKFEVRDEDGQ